MKVKIDVTEPLDLDYVLTLDYAKRAVHAKAYFVALAEAYPDLMCAKCPKIYIVTSGVRYAVESSFGKMVMKKETLPESVVENMRLLSITEDIKERDRYMELNGSVSKWKQDAYNKAVREDREKIGAALRGETE
jgi:hypothetical protein